MPAPPHTHATVQGAQGLVAKAVGEGKAVSPRNTFTRVLNDWFGVSMPERWRAARKQVNPSENSYGPGTSQVVPCVSTSADAVAIGAKMCSRDLRDGR